MSTMDAEVFEAFRSVGIADDKAILAAQALGRRDSDVGDMKHDLASLGPDVRTLKHDVSALKTDMVLLKWMVGVVMALSVTILFKVFHA